MKYKISIIIPFKNATKFINQSLNNTSRLVKKFKNIEVIYIDYNSNDKSYEILSDKISKLQNFKLLKSNSKIQMLNLECLAQILFILLTKRLTVMWSYLLLFAVSLTNTWIFPVIHHKCKV